MTSAAIFGPFLLTIAITFLIGTGLREYYLGEQKVETFGTVRTFVLIGLLGFVLSLPTAPGFYIAGQLSLAAILTVYYVDKLRQKKGAGIIGILIGLLTFAIGPLAMREPPWVAVLVAISVLFALHSKSRIRRFTDRLSPGEVLTVCKFLAIAAVVLPVIPVNVSPAQGRVAHLLALLPVTPRQLWIAVVITTSISYAGYIAHVYLFPARGLQLTGLFGGVYSSTATVLVIAKRSARSPARDAAAAVLFAITMMYVRLAVLVAIFRPALLRQSALPLSLLAAAALSCGLWLRPRKTEEVAPDAPRDQSIQHPLEVTTALLFAATFALVAAATKYTLVLFPVRGLSWLAFAVGFSDVTPFVVSILQGNLGVTEPQLIRAILIASASNNVLKTAYIWSAGSRALARAVSPILLSLAGASLLYSFWP